MGGVFGELPCAIIHYPETLYKIAFKIGKFPEKVVSWVYNSNTAKQHRDVAFFDVKPNFNQRKQPYKNPMINEFKKELQKGKRVRDYMIGGT